MKCKYKMQLFSTLKEKTMPISVEKTVFDTLNQRLDVFQQKQKAAPVVDLSTTKRQHYKPITYQSYFDSIARWSTGLVERFEQRTFIPTAAQSYANAQYDSRTLQGDEVIRNTRRDFLACSPPPTSVQKRMFETYLQVKAPRIYGAEWESDKCAILKRNAWREYDGILLTLTGRKEGKSTGLAQNCLSTVLNVPNWRIAVFSRTREQAQIILLLVIHMFRKHPRAAEFKATFSKREFTISTATDTRTITAYSGDANVSVVCCLFLFLASLLLIRRYVRC